MEYGVHARFISTAKIEEILTSVEMRSFFSRAKTINITTKVTTEYHGHPVSIVFLHERTFDKNTKRLTPMQADLIEKILGESFRMIEGGVMAVSQKTS